MMIARTYTCADCRREGVDAPQTLDDYYVYLAKNRMPVRSPYCKRHMRARSTTRLRARLNPASAHYDAQLHERQKKAKRESMQRARATRR